MAKYYKMGSRRQKIHRKIYDVLVKNGLSPNEAYEVASRVTNWA